MPFAYFIWMISRGEGIKHVLSVLQLLADAAPLRALTLCPSLQERFAWGSKLQALQAMALEDLAVGATG